MKKRLKQIGALVLSSAIVMAGAGIVSSNALTESEFSPGAVIQQVNSNSNIQYSEAELKTDNIEKRVLFEAEAEQQTHNIKYSTLGC